MENAGEEKRARVLDPVDRVSEVIFGLLMAMTFVGSLSVASAGQEEVRTMMITALGCNLAWGLADAVMHLIRTATARTRTRTLLAHLRGGAEPARGQALIADILPPPFVAAVGPDALEILRRGLAQVPANTVRAPLQWDDFRAALGIFLLVVFATFPVVVPFMVLDEAMLAVRVSNAVALGMLFLAGCILARYSGGSLWRSGVALALTGAALMAAIMALGG
jgi:VIT1/CCC1 family predicted Fe2+/Mn2+ transporter